MQLRYRPTSLTALAGIGLFTALTALPVLSEAAVVYCTGGPGVPKGCVVRPTAPVVYCTAPDVPAGCVSHPAARAATHPHPVARGATRSPTNLNGGVNRVGVRR